MTADGVHIRRVITPRQAEIIELYAEGLAPKDVAARLHLTLTYVWTATSRAMQRVNASNRTHLTAMWVRGELIAKDDRGRKGQPRPRHNR